MCSVLNAFALARLVLPLFSSNWVPETLSNAAQLILRRAVSSRIALGPTIEVYR